MRQGKMTIYLLGLQKNAMLLELQPQYGLFCLFYPSMQFPMYWFSVPAIMKGWLDRVLVQGFAFSLEKMYNNGIFKVCLTQKYQNTA